MTAQSSNCNLFVLFGVSVINYILRVVPQDDAIPPWLNSGKVTDNETPDPCRCFILTIFRAVQ